MGSFALGDDDADKKWVAWIPMGLFALGDDDKMQYNDIKLQCEDVVPISRWRRQVWMKIYFVVANPLCRRGLVRTSLKLITFKLYTHKRLKWIEIRVCTLLQSQDARCQTNRFTVWSSRLNSIPYWVTENVSASRTTCGDVRSLITNSCSVRRARVCRTGHVEWEGK